MRPDQQHSASEAEPLFDDGGNAFPSGLHPSQDPTRAMQGMALRDYFAGQALAGWVAALPMDGRLYSREAARVSYELADAMLEARKTK